MQQSPTPSNILSSLGVKGARTDGGVPAAAGYVPVLGPDGKLSPSVIPISGVIAEVSTLPLSKVAFADITTVSDIHNGSANSPFRTISAAANAGFQVVVASSGTYSESTVSFVESFSTVCLIGLGACTVNRPSDTLVITGPVPGGTIMLQDVNIPGSVVVRVAGRVIMTGKSYVGNLRSILQDSEDPSSAAPLVLEIGPSSRVGSTNASTIRCLADTDYIGNVSTVRGGRLTAALDRLDARKVRLPGIAYDEESGIVESGTVDIDADGSSSGYDVYDLGQYERTLFEVLNENFVRMGRDAVLRDVKVSGASRFLGDMSLNAATVKRHVDIVDSVTGRKYRITMEDGYVKVDDLQSDASDSSDSSSGSGGGGVPGDINWDEIQNLPLTGRQFDLSDYNGIIAALGVAVEALGGTANA